jgi:hypothetical protein
MTKTTTVGDILRKMVGKRITAVRDLNDHELHIEGADSGVIVEINDGAQCIVVCEKSDGGRRTEAFWMSLDHRVDLVDGSLETY